MKINRVNAVLVMFLLIFQTACSRNDMDETDHLAKARHYLQTGKHRAAIIELKNSLQKNPESKEARLLLGREYLLLGDSASAEKELRKAGTLGAGAEARPLLARALLLGGKYQELLEEFSAQSSKTANPGVELLVALGEAALKLDKIDQAKAYYQRASSLQPDSYDVFLGQAKLMLYQDKVSDAAAYLKKALHKDPEGLAAWNLKGFLFFKQAKFQDALDAFRQARQLGEQLPFNPEVFRSQIGVIQAELALRHHEAARRDIEALMKRVPRHPLPKYYRALLAFQEGDFDTAHDYLQELIAKQQGGLPTELLFGAVNYAKGNYEQAIMHLEHFIAKVPEHLPARKMLAAAYLHQQQPDKAQTVLKPAMTVARNDAELLSLVGKAAILGGDLEKGERYLKSAVRAAPGEASLHEDLARFYMKSGKYEQAIAELEGISGDKELQAKVMLIVAHLRNKETDQAVAIARQLLAQSPDNPHLHYLLGRVYLLAGDQAAARKHFLKAAELEPGIATANLMLAELALVDGQPGEAEQFLQRVLRADSGNIQAMLTLARVKLSLQEQSAALEWIEKAKNAKPDDPRPYLMLGRYYLNAGQLRQALQIIAEVPEQYADSLPILALLGKAQFMAGRLREALSTYQELARRMPDRPSILFDLSGIQQALHDYRGADESLAQALKLAPHFLQAQAARVHLALLMGDSKKALKLAQALRKQHPSSVLGLILEGDVYLQRKDYQQAQRRYGQALQSRPASVIVTKLAQAYSEAKQDAKAAEVLSDWLKAHPDDLRARVLLATHYQRQGDIDKAIVHYKKILEQQSDNYVALNNLAVLYMARDPEQARDYAQRAYGLMPGNASVIDTLGWILVQSKSDTAEGVALLREAMRLAPDVAEIQYHLAAGLSGSGHHDEAKALLSELLAGNRDFEGRDDARQLLERLK